MINNDIINDTDETENWHFINWRFLVPAKYEKVGS